MSIVEKSNNAADVLCASPILHARIEMARQRLRFDVRMELIRLGASCSDEAVSKIIDGLPEDVLAGELAART